MSEYKKIGLIVADTDEFSPLAKIIKQGNYSEDAFLKRKILKFVSGNAEIIAIHCGIGKVNAAAAAVHLIDIGCEAVLNYGFSGGLGTAKKNELYLCDRFTEHDFDLTMIGYKPCEKPGQDSYIYKSDGRLDRIIRELLPDIKSGTAVTGDCFICDSARSRFLSETFNAVSCDMETAAIAYVCEYAGVPFACVRKISDGADESAEESYREVNTSGEDYLQRLIIKVAVLAAEKL